MTFIPDSNATKSTVPFFEDNSQWQIPGRGTHKSIAVLQKEIRDYLTKMGAYGVTFASGQTDQLPIRSGFRIEFSIGAFKGQIVCLALPMKKRTTAKINIALKQALYLVRNKLESEFYSTVYETGAMPLLPYLLDNSGRTFAQSFAEKADLPLLMAGAFRGDER